MLNKIKKFIFILCSVDVVAVVLLLRWSVAGQPALMMTCLKPKLSKQQHHGGSSGGLGGGSTSSNKAAAKPFSFVEKDLEKVKEKAASLAAKEVRRQKNGPFSSRSYTLFFSSFQKNEDFIKNLRGYQSSATAGSSVRLKQCFFFPRNDDFLYLYSIFSSTTSVPLASSRSTFRSWTGASDGPTPPSRPPAPPTRSRSKAAATSSRPSPCPTTACPSSWPRRRRRRRKWHRLALTTEVRTVVVVVALLIPGFISNLIITS